MQLCMYVWSYTECSAKCNYNLMHTFKILAQVSTITVAHLILIHSQLNNKSVHALRFTVVLTTVNFFYLLSITYSNYKLNSVNGTVKVICVAEPKLFGWDPDPRTKSLDPDDPNYLDLWQATRNFQNWCHASSYFMYKMLKLQDFHH